MVEQVICKKCRSLTLRSKHGTEPCYFCGVRSKSIRVPMIWDRKTCPQCREALILGKCQFCLDTPRILTFGDPDDKSDMREEAKGNGSGGPVRAPDDLVTKSGHVGNCLAELIPAWAVGSAKGCKCKDIRVKLNKMGPDACEAKLDWIVQKLKGQKKYLRGALRKLPDSVAQCGVRFLVKKAIRMSREK